MNFNLSYLKKAIAVVGLTAIGTIIACSSATHPNQPVQPDPSGQNGGGNPPEPAPDPSPSPSPSSRPNLLFYRTELDELFSFDGERSVRITLDPVEEFQVSPTHIAYITNNSGPKLIKLYNRSTQQITTLFSKPVNEEKIPKDRSHGPRIAISNNYVAWTSRNFIFTQNVLNIYDIEEGRTYLELSGYLNPNHYLHSPRFFRNKILVDYTSTQLTIASPLNKRERAGTVTLTEGISHYAPLQPQSTRFKVKGDWMVYDNLLSTGSSSPSLMLAHSERGTVSSFSPIAGGAGIGNFDLSNTFVVFSRLGVSPGSVDLYLVDHSGERVNWFPYLLPASNIFSISDSHLVYITAPETPTAALHVWNLTTHQEMTIDSAAVPAATIVELYAE